MHIHLKLVHQDLAVLDLMRSVLFSNQFHIPDNRLIIELKILHLFLRQDALMVFFPKIS